MHWITSLDDKAVRGFKDDDGSVIVWRLHQDQAETFAAGVRPTAADLRDAARAKRDSGAARLLRRRLLKALIVRAMDRHPDQVNLDRRPDGAIQLAGPTPTFVSAAGRSGQIVVALGRRPLGVDLETLQPGFPLPFDALTPGERESIERLPSAERDRAFLKLWTVKEAYAKALGRGLALAPERIEVSDGDRVRAPGEPRGRAEIRMDPDAVVAAVVLDGHTVITAAEAPRVARPKPWRRICG